MLGDAGDLETEGDRSWSGRHGSRQATASATGGPEREQIGGVDIVYLKNVVLKFLDAQANGRADQVLAPPLIFLEFLFVLVIHKRQDKHSRTKRCMRYMFSHMLFWHCSSALSGLSSQRRGSRLHVKVIVCE